MLIGTHDSGAYTLSGVIPNLPIIGGIIKRLTLTQTLPIYHQLEAGARILDLRVAINWDTPYLAHTFLCGKLDCELSRIADFALLHPHDKVYVNIRPDRWHKDQFRRKHNVKLVVDCINKHFSGFKNIIVNSDKAPFNAIFPSTYREVASGANKPEEIVRWFHSKAPYEYGRFANFNVAATPKNLIKMLLKGKSLVEVGRESQMFYRPNAITQELFGVMFDGLLKKD